MARQVFHQRLRIDFGARRSEHLVQDDQSSFADAFADGEARGGILDRQKDEEGFRHRLRRTKVLRMTRLEGDETSAFFLRACGNAVCTIPTGRNRTG